MCLFTVSNTLLAVCSVLHQISLQHSTIKEENYFLSSYESIFFSGNKASTFYTKNEASVNCQNMESYDHENLHFRYLSVYACELLAVN